MTFEQEERLKRYIKTVINENKDIVNDYKKGKRGLIGPIMNKVISMSDISFYSKESKIKLITELKEQLS